MTHIKVLSPMGDPRAVRIAARFLLVRKRFMKGALRCIVELGRLLLKGRMVVKGQFGAWLRRELHIGYTTAERYMQIFLAQRRDPETVNRLLGFGSGRALLRLARLTPKGALVARDHAHELHSVADLLRITAPYVRVTRRRRPIQLAETVRRHAMQLRKRVRELPDLEIGGARLRARLEEALRALEADIRRALSALTHRRKHVATA